MNKYPGCILLVAVFIFSTIACSTNRFKNGLRHGKWKYIQQFDSLEYKYSGRYRKGLEKGTWNYYLGKSLTRKEVYKKGVGTVTFYHSNGIVSSQGMTKLVSNEKEIHWYYFGDWEFFDEQGELISIKSYEKGKLIKERVVN